MRGAEFPSGLIWANWGLFGLIGAYSLQMNSHATPIGRDFAAVLVYADYRNFQSVIELAYRMFQQRRTGGGSFR